MICVNFCGGNITDPIDHNLQLDNVHGLVDHASGNSGRWPVLPEDVQAGDHQLHVLLRLDWYEEARQYEEARHLICEKFIVNTSLIQSIVDLRTARFTASIPLAAADAESVSSSWHPW